MTECNFGAAAPDEDIVYGACRPGYHAAEPQRHVDAWLQTMQEYGVERVCCLLDRKLQLYDELLQQYADVFGSEAVCHAPVRDYSAVSRRTLTETIWPFLRSADQAHSPVVVHCSAGQGRTGQILVVWLAVERNYQLDDALSTVQETGRSPLEAATYDDLQDRVTVLRDRA